MSKTINCTVHLDAPESTGDRRQVFVFYQVVPDGESEMSYCEVSQVFSEGGLPYNILCLLHDLSFIGDYSEFRDYVATLFPTDKYRHICKLVEGDVVSGIHGVLEIPELHIYKF